MACHATSGGMKCGIHPCRGLLHGPGLPGAVSRTIVKPADGRTHSINQSDYSGITELLLSMDIYLEIRWPHRPAITEAENADEP